MNNCCEDREDISLFSAMAKPFTCDEGQFFKTLAGIKEMAEYTFTGDALEAAKGVFAKSPASDMALSRVRPHPSPTDASTRFRSTKGSSRYSLLCSKYV
eukprot:gene226-biopygen13296